MIWQRMVRLAHGVATGNEGDEVPIVQTIDTQKHSKADGDAVPIVPTRRFRRPAPVIPI
jgi:hypothetical protein